MATHSDKALTTIVQMGTTPEQWALAPIKWVKEQRMVKGSVTCPECLGNRHCRYQNGVALPIPKVSRNSMHFSPDVVAQREYIALARNESTNPYAGTYGTCRKCQKNGYSTGSVVGMVLRMVDVGYPVWPEGTQFNSRFRAGCNCNLCNKFIMKSNMVPVLAKDANGNYHGMWVGQDCGKKFLATKPPKKFGDESFFIAAFEEYDGVDRRRSILYNLFIDGGNGSCPDHPPKGATPMENIVSKIQKLLALASNEAATPAEAENAAIAAQRLVNKYNLDMAQIIEEAKVKGEEPAVNKEPIESVVYKESKRIARWEALLGFHLAPAFSCRGYNAKSYKVSKLVVVGRTTNVAAFKATFEYLLSAIEKTAKASKPGYVHGREWNASFGIGAVEGIIDRIREEQRQIEAANPSMALMLRDEATEVSNWLKERVTLRNGPAVRSSNVGRSAGRSAASGLNLGSVPGRTYNNAPRLGA